MLMAYEPSGRSGPLLSIWGLLAIGALVASGWVYQLAIDWIPLIFLNALLTAGYGFLGFVMVGLALNYSKCRSPVFGVLLGLAVGLAGTAGTHYFAYARVIDTAMAQYEKETDKPAEREKMTQALPIASYFETRVEQGWRISSMPISGFFVYLIWFIEALLIIGISVLGGWLAGREPFCESCNVWADEERLLLTRWDQSDEAVEQLDGATTLDELINPPTTRPHWTAEKQLGTSWLDYKVNACPNCEESRFLSISKNWVELDTEGDETEKSNEVHEYLVIDAEIAEQLEQLAVTLVPAEREPESEAETEQVEE